MQTLEFLQKESGALEFCVYSGDEIEAGTDKKTKVPEESDRKKKTAARHCLTAA